MRKAMLVRLAFIIFTADNNGRHCVDMLRHLHRIHAGGGAALVHRTRHQVRAYRREC
jgi:hypothetical protein